jgi:hypothetical protein
MHGQHTTCLIYADHQESRGPCDGDSWHYGAGVQIFSQCMHFTTFKHGFGGNAERCLMHCTSGSLLPKEDFLAAVTCSSAVGTVEVATIASLSLLRHFLQACSFGLCAKDSKDCSWCFETCKVMSDC